MRQLSERMRDRLKVNDHVSKKMLANVRLLPKVSAATRPSRSGNVCVLICFAAAWQYWIAGVS